MAWDIFNGSGPPGTISGQNEGDNYIDTDNGDLYQYQSGAWAKIGNLPIDMSPIDVTAIHKATASEISAITAKATPIDADFLLIEDSDDGNKKKSITRADLFDSAITSIGVGVAPSAAALITTYHTATNAAWGNTTLYINRRSISNVNGAYYPFGLYVTHYPKINTGVTDTGRCEGAYVNVQRNGVASDAGTLTSIYGIEIIVGHATTYTEACTTTYVMGILISPQAKSGTITNLYGLYIQAPASGGTITNEYGIVQQSATALNQFAGRISSTLADGTAPYTSVSKTVCTNVNADLHDGYHEKVVNIGDWNMDSTASVTVAHGVTTGMAKIVSIKIFIRNDADSAYYPVDYFSTTVSGTYYWDATNVVITRTASGFFDGTDFNATSFNRGYIIVRYIP